jgi:hypothetical protein
MVFVTIIPLLISVVILIGFTIASVMDTLESRISPKQQAAMESYVAPNHLQNSFTEEEMGVFRRAFFNFDSDGSGGIDKEELLYSFKQFNSSESGDVVDRALESLNLQGDSEISFANFLHIVLKARTLGGHNHFEILATKAASDKRKRAHLFVYIFLALTFVCMVGCSTVVLQFFKCQEFVEAENEEESGRPPSYMQKDFSISCNTPRYAKFRIFAVLMVLVGTLVGD